MGDILITIKTACATIGGAIGYFFGGIDGIMIALISLVVADYLTGVSVAFVQKKVSSNAGFKGIIRKLLIFVLVGSGTMLDHHVLGGNNVLRTAIIFFYIANEGISICENCGNLGVPIPKKLKDALAQIKDKSEEESENIADDSNQG